MSSHKPSDKNELVASRGEVLVYQTESGEVKVENLPIGKKPGEPFVSEHANMGNEEGV